MAPMKWFWRFLKKYCALLLFGLLMTTVIAVLAIVNPYISGLIVDDVIQGGNLTLLPRLILTLLSVTLVRGILRFAHQVIFETCSQGVLYDMRDRFFRRLLMEDFAFFSRKKTGDLMSRQTGDMDAIRHFVAYIIYAVYENMLMFIFALSMIFTVNVKLALCMIFVLPFTALTTFRQSKDVRPTFARIRDRFSSLNSFVQENVSGNRVVKAFAKEDFEIEKFNRENDAYQEAQLASSRVWMKYLPVFEVLSYLLNVILMLYGGYMVIQGEISMGNLVTVNGYLWMLNGPLRMAGWWVNDIHRFITSVEKIYDTYVEEPSIKMPAAPVENKHMEGNVEFCNVSYSADGEDIVKDISFTAKKGQTIGILGSTGAGKSTVMNLLCRFVDATSGKVLVDGVDVRDLNLQKLRDNIGMAMQDIFLFSDTIEGNIAYGRPDCSFEEIHEAAVMADANHFIQRMPEGYDTIVGERGVGLSGGQKQRISLARALLKKPSILILDDTTSAVDMETESYIQSQLKKLGGQCTVFVIAYRISSIKDADQILVMDNGRIIEKGTHQELLAKTVTMPALFIISMGKSLPGRKCGAPVLPERPSPHSGKQNQQFRSVSRRGALFCALPGNAQKASAEKRETMARNKYDVDEILEDKFDINQLKRLLGYLKPYRKRFASVAALMLSASAFTMLIPQFFLKIMDESIPAGDMKSVAFYSGLTLLAALYSAFSLRYKIKHTNIIGQQIIHDLRYDIFRHLQDLPFSYYDNRPHGKIQVRVVNYVNSLSDLLSNGILNTITDLCNLFFIVAFMLLTNVRLTLLCLCGLPVLAVVVVFIKKKQRKAWQIQSNKQSNLNAYIAESINGIRVTQSFVREEMNSNIFNSLSSSYRKSWMHACMYNFTMGPSVDIISMVTTSAIYVLGIHWMFDSASPITVGVLVAFTAYVGRFWAPINTLAGFYNSLLTAISYLERIFETIDEPVSVKDAPDAATMPPIKGEVTFEHVTFSYEPEMKILDDVNFHAKIGDTFAIVGPTGAGKTTLVNLLSRFYNLDSGRILIDGTDISKVTIHSLRAQMGVMMQDSFIFAGTIMDNIRYGNYTATDEEVIRAAKTVCAHDFIMEMENGYYTEVNERGSRLSVGQRQLISFARALLADPRILILDEATSSIDTETEIILQKGLNELLKGRTSFIIAHRLSTIKNADCIMYVDQGNILEKGTHEELMARNGEYYRLYMSQYANCA